MKPMQLYIPKDIVDKAAAIAGDQKIDDVMRECLRNYLGVHVVEVIADTDVVVQPDFPVWGSIPAPVKRDA